MFLFLLIICIAAGFASAETECDYDYYWRDFNGTIPSDAIEGGNKKNPFFVGQVYIRNRELLPASIFPGQPEAVTSAYNIVLRTKDNIKILCGKDKENFVWIPTTSEKLSLLTKNHLIIGGNEVGQTIYIGRLLHQGRIVMGKVFEHHLASKGVWVPSENREQNSLTYEVLSYQCPEATQVFPCIDIKGENTFSKK